MPHHRHLTQNTLYIVSAYLILVYLPLFSFPKENRGDEKTVCIATKKKKKKKKFTALLLPLPRKVQPNLDPNR